MRINPESTVSIYLQVAEQIKKDIEERKLKPSELLPPDHFYCEQLNVSHMTVKKAIDVLVSEGLVVRRKGIGTFVAEPKIIQSLFTLTGFTGDNEKLGKTVHSSVLNFEMVKATGKVAKALHVADKTKVVNLKRLRFADDTPVAIEDSYIYLPQGSINELLKHDFSSESLYQILREKCSVKMKHAEETIEVTGATSEICNYLEIAQGRYVFLLNRTTFDKDNIAFEYVESVYRADKYIFSAFLV